MASEVASFMSIPPELRLQIYQNLDFGRVEHVVCLPPGRYAWMDLKRDGQSAQRILHLDRLSLSLTCKVIRAEVGDFISRNSTDIRTYALKLLLEQDLVRRTTWRSLPCHPQSVDVLSVDCILGKRLGLRRWSSFYGDGGFRAVIGDLY
ncbi:hypothetical protein DOTSEDRAFT_71472 [Dothistroma septosporum NZE10]|uniref:F-box domain-containing protein n=1 Tax=Dothistroma septosporum (strain NZE10 / CBS 128990) TaxID=675120 RepID=N1PS80_DOTSN|nr:hypothetical protein DOTSEDRAFT_71472 [Dothistroma septosporum NZE10]